MLQINVINGLRISRKCYKHCFREPTDLLYFILGVLSRSSPQSHVIWPMVLPWVKKFYSGEVKAANGHCPVLLHEAWVGMGPNTGWHLWKRSHQEGVGQQGTQGILMQGKHITHSPAMGLRPMQGNIWCVFHTIKHISYSRTSSSTADPFGLWMSVFTLSLYFYHVSSMEAQEGGSTVVGITGLRMPQEVCWLGYFRFVPCTSSWVPCLL